MRFSVKYISLVLIAASALACADKFDEDPVESAAGQEAVLPLNLSVVPFGYGLNTRALPSGMEESNEISDAWIIQYDKDTEEIVGFPDYYTIDEINGTPEKPASVTVILPPIGKTYLYIVVANTSDPELFAEKADLKTLDQLKAKSRVISSLKDTYMLSPDGKAKFIMSGYLELEGSLEEPVLDFKLYRNVAKLTVNITNGPDSGVEIETVRLCGVPGKSFYADCLYDYSVMGGGSLSFYNENPVPSANETTYSDFSYEDCEIAVGGDSKTLVYYLPRNCRGIEDASTSAHTKNYFASDKASNVEVIAVQKASGRLTRYTFYLGRDMIKDFNVQSNHHYTLNLSITDVGTVSADPRIEDIHEITLEEANSYIVNPLGTSAAQIYTMPVAKRSNRWWKTVQGSSVPENVINDGDEWIMEVIWQDQPRRLITFCDADGGNERDTYIGIGDMEPLHFKLKRTDGQDYKLEGNVVIGVKKKSVMEDGDDANDYSSYLWSWHLWITDYSPDEIDGVEWVDGKYEHNVRGGKVNRHDDKNNISVWSGSGAYVNKWIMDRNIGALDGNYTEYNTDFYRVTGLAYQFGRKDPFLFYTNAELNRTDMYDLAGAELYGKNAYSDLIDKPKDYVATKRKVGQGTITQSIQTPYVFYTLYTDSDWVSSNEYGAGGVVWNNPPAYQEEIETEKNTSVSKSLFDPCPPGWQVPSPNVWSIFSAAAPFDKGRYFYMQKNPVEGDDVVFYSANGYRNYIQRANAAVNNIGTHGYYWMSNSWSTIHGYMMTFTYSGSFSYGNHTTRGYGLPVRCVQE